MNAPVAAAADRGTPVPGAVCGDGLSWASIARLGLVQVAIGAVIVLMTSTLNRVMVVEIGLPAVIPGALVGLHFFVQLLRPRMGYGSDAAERRLPWVWGGMLVVVVSGVAAAGATAWMAVNPVAGLLAAGMAFALLGLGVSAAATPLLAYLAERVAPRRMAGAAAVVWIMMIAGIIVSAGVAGSLLDPFSYERLVAVTAGVSVGALLLTVLALVGRDDGAGRFEDTTGGGEEVRFSAALQRLWDDDESRRFAIFVFVSMLAYSMQDIILEPFAGTVFGLSPGESTRIAGLQHGGVLAGMAVGAWGCARFGTLRGWSAVGCVASAVCLVALLVSPAIGSVAALKASVVGLGVSNGVFAVAAIGAMMGLTVGGDTGGAGLRMGLWGAAQAAAYGLGGILGGGASDIGRLALGSAGAGYGAVFLAEAVLFVAAAAIVMEAIPWKSTAGRRQRRVATLDAARRQEVRP